MAEAASLDLDYLKEMSGQGFEGMDSKDVAIPMLLVSQPLSSVVTNGTVKVGHFYNSISGKDYGDTLQVVVLSFTKAWVEWKPNGAGFVGRHPVGGIEVTGDPYTGMKHGENDVIETWMYLVVLPEHLEDGYLLFQSTRGNLKYLKGWNTQLRYLKTPDGQQAAIFAGIWEMSLSQDTNKAGQKYFSCNKDGKSSIHQVGWVTEELFKNYVLPGREMSQEKVLAIADTATENEATEDVTVEGNAF